MELSDSELRALVRDAIGRLTTHHPMAGVAEQPTYGPHASHRLLPLASGSDGDGACLIEPSVGCTHCGYCLSFGH